MTIELGKSSWHGFATETLWVEDLGDNQYEIRNIPFFTMGLAFKDIVSAYYKNNELIFEKVIHRSKRSTYRILVQRKNLDNLKNIDLEFLKINKFSSNYETYEQINWIMYALDVPLHCVSDIYKILENGEKMGYWDFEEAYYGGVV